MAKKTAIKFSREHSFPLSSFTYNIKEEPFSKVLDYTPYDLLSSIEYHQGTYAECMSINKALERIKEMDCKSINIHQKTGYIKGFHISPIKEINYQTFDKKQSYLKSIDKGLEESLEFFLNGNELFTVDKNSDIIVKYGNHMLTESMSIILKYKVETREPGKEQFEAIVNQKITAKY
jgi:hypothetical protein